MTDEQLYKIYIKVLPLPDSIQSKESDDESLTKIKLLIQSNNPHIYSAAFCDLVHDIFVDNLFFDEAQSVLEEAIERNKKDKTLDNDQMEVLDKIHKLKNPAYRKFYRLSLFIDEYADPKEICRELEEITKEGYEDADVWGLLGGA